MLKLIERILVKKGIDPAPKGVLSYAKMSFAGFGFTGFASALTLILLPARVLDIAPEASKNTYLGILSFAGLILAIVTQPIAGWISDRTRLPWGRRRPFILLGGFLTLVLLPGFGMASNFVTLLLFLCLIQVAINIAIGPYQALIRDLVPYERRGLASGVKGFMETSGGAVLSAVAGLLVGMYTTSHKFGWVWLSLLVIGIAILIGATITVLFVKEVAAGPANIEPRVLEKPSRKVKHETHPDFAPFLLSRFVIVLAGATLQTYALFFLGGVVKLSNPAGAASLLVIVVGGSMLIAMYPAGLLTDRVGRKGMMMAGGGLGALPIILLLFVHSLAGVMVIGVVAGVAMGTFLSANWAMATDLVAKGHTAQQLGYVNLATAGGAAVARLNGPWVDVVNRRQPELGYSVLLIMCGVLFLIGGLLVMRLKSEDQQAGEAGRDAQPVEN